MSSDEVIRVIVNRPNVLVKNGRGQHGITGETGIHASRGEWTIGLQYFESDWVYHARAAHGKGMYRSLTNHWASALNEPETGASWEANWERGPEGGADGSGDVTGPVSTTENKMPQWDAATKHLKDGLPLATTIGDPGSDSVIPTEQAVREALLAVSLDGWVAAGETWTYAAADAPSFTITISGDKTTKYYPGMKIKLTQTTIKYFIFTKVAYSSPNTTITLFGGTDYSLVSAAITVPYFSMAHVPAGFPMDPDKWAVTATLGEDGHQTNPVSDTWYNIGTFTISVPIGIWEMTYMATIENYSSSSSFARGAYVTLSTANNSESNTSATCCFYMTSCITLFMSMRLARQVMNVTAKTTYYLNELTVDSGAVEQLGLFAGTYIKLYCAYL